MVKLPVLFNAHIFCIDVILVVIPTYKPLLHTSELHKRCLFSCIFYVFDHKFEMVRRSPNTAV